MRYVTVLQDINDLVKTGHITTLDLKNEIDVNSVWYVVDESDELVTLSPVDESSYAAEITMRRSDFCASTMDINVTSTTDNLIT